MLGQVMSAMFLGNAFVGLFLGRLSGSSLLTGGRGARGLVQRGCLLMAGLYGVFLALDLEVVPKVSVDAYTYLGMNLVLSLVQFPMATSVTAVTTALVSSELQGTLVGVEHAIYAS